MTIEKQFCSYEIALRLKELGFTLDRDDSFGRYTLNGELIKFPLMSAERTILAPLWQQAIDWFREKHNINIEINYLPNIRKYGVVCSDKSYFYKDVVKHVAYMHGKEVTFNFVKFDTYEEAREYVILKAIELCQNQKK